MPGKTIKGKKVDYRIFLRYHLIIGIIISYSALISEILAKIVSTILSLLPLGSNITLYMDTIFKVSISLSGAIYNYRIYKRYKADLDDVDSLALLFVPWSGYAYTKAIS